MVEVVYWFCIVFCIYLLLNTLFVINMLAQMYAETGRISLDFHDGWMYIAGICCYIPILIYVVIDRKIKNGNDE